MPKKARKKKRLSSSSSEENEKATRWGEFTKYKSTKREGFNSSYGSNTKKQKDCGPQIREGSQDVRQIKKATYGLAKSNNSSDEKEVASVTTQHMFRPRHGSSCSTQAKNCTLGKGIVTNASDKVVGAPLEPFHIYSPDTALQRGEKTFQCDLQNESQKTATRLVKHSTSSSSATVKMQEPRKTLVKRSSKREVSPKSGKESKNTNIRKQREITSPAVKLRLNSIEMIKRKCQARRREDLKTMNNLCVGAKNSSVSSSSKTKTQSYTPTECIISNSNAPKQRNVPSVSHVTDKSACTPPLMSPNTPAPHPNVRIPKKAQPLLVSRARWMDKKDSISTKTRNNTSGTEPSGFETSLKNAKQTKVVEELHQARSENILKLKVSESYGELTCMEIDPPEEWIYSGEKPCQQDLIIVLDTNILLSHLDFVKTITSHGLGARGFPVALIPWVVLQELDSLKNKRRLASSMTHLAFPAVNYIYNCLKSQEPHLWGQSMQQATQISHELNAENNDDRVLQCCLQYQILYPKSTLILCTNDKNLCSKAFLSGVKAFSQADLLEKFGRNNTGLLCPTYMELPAPKPDQSCPQPQTQGYQRISFYKSDVEKGNKQRIGWMVEEERSRELGRGVALMENCLREVLSEILKVEMKAIYDDLWEEIVYLKPPWTLPNVLQCFKKHWIAVFGTIIPRSEIKAVTTLIDFFTSGKRVEYITTLQALSTAKELLRVFERRSNYSQLVPAAISSLDEITHSLQSQPEKTEKCYPDHKAAISGQGSKQAPCTQALHQEVWALLENIWQKVYHMSLAVFTALNFDPGQMQCTQPEGIPLPQDALAYLYKLSPTVTQLLQALNSLQSPDAGARETQVLLSLIHSNKIFEIETKLKVEDLLNCFSQQEYREKLRVGGGQLTELKAGLDRCLDEMSRRSARCNWQGLDQNQGSLNHTNQP
ncbi:transcriptional protein SWT1 [Lampris incognitus]|uniref:transcriptional protein SWT1 n=1 Tax=Lampris incognitus TaxID=2546036 RepID=UPI0024B59F0E|nr:transcriptional protein SWT1 [Lampris incognitus]